MPTQIITPHGAEPAPAGPVARAPGRRPRRRRVALAGAAVLLAAGVATLAGGILDGDAAPARPASTDARADTGRSAGRVTARTAAQERGGKAGDGDQVDPLAPLPKARPKVVAPVAGQVSGADGGAKHLAGGARAGAKDQTALPKPTGPASEGANGQGGSEGVHDLSVTTATALPNGVALPPLEAPEAVLQVIRAGNTIARTPYKWGGGHGSFKDNGYDCSGSVSFALYSAGLIGGSATSGALMSYGRPGPGRWITIYANQGHVFMKVAGIRFDTVGRAVTGSRWQNDMVSTGGFVVRHPPGY